MFTITFSKAADDQLQKIENNPAQEALEKQIKKSLGCLQINPKHPSLRTHQYINVDHPWDLKEKVFEAYVQNNTPGAYRIFWCYGPRKREITILAITKHP